MTARFAAAGGESCAPRLLQAIGQLAQAIGQLARAIGRLVQAIGRLLTSTAVCCCCCCSNRHSPEIHYSSTLYNVYMIGISATSLLLWLHTARLIFPDAHGNMYMYYKRHTSISTQYNAEISLTMNG